MEASKTKAPSAAHLRSDSFELGHLEEILGSHTTLQYPGDLKVNLWEYIGVIVLRKKGIQGHLLYH